MISIQDSWPTLATQHKATHDKLGQARPKQSHTWSRVWHADSCSAYAAELVMQSFSFYQAGLGGMGA